MEKFNIPNNLWLKFGCFLTGYNYQLLSESSETSKKYIKKITSALIIIISIWSMVGYMFASRYAGAGVAMSIISGIIAGIIIVQIERQIILGGKVKKRTIIFRLLLGLIVAVIGALILDQVFFKNDIEKKKRDLVDIRINQRVGSVQKDAEINIAANTVKIDSLQRKIEENIEIASKAGFRYQTSSKKTVIPSPSNSNIPSPPEKKNPSSITYENSYGQHPKLEENNILRSQINIYESNIKDENDSLYSRKQKAKIEALNEPPGFLDELTIIVNLATQSGIALFAYIMFLLFFVFIELFIVLAKLSDGDNDYHRLVQYQELIREERLKVLEQKRSASIGENQKIDNSSTFINQGPK